MIFTEKWVREWVDLKVDTEGLVACLTMAGLEVDSVMPAGPALDRVVVGCITEVTSHPQASHLQVCRVDVGGKEPLDIVCGAPNARAGLYAPVALTGASLPSGAKIEQVMIRDTTSNVIVRSGSSAW